MDNSINHNGTDIHTISPWFPGPDNKNMTHELNIHEVHERPCFRTYDAWFILQGKRLQPGLYYHAYQNKQEQEPLDTWVCSPIHAEAQACNEQLNSWGLLLRFMNPLGQWRQWTMPIRLLKGNGEELRGMLLDMGVRINPDAHRQLQQWLAKVRPEKHILAVTRTGWHQHKGELIFVFPERAIGSDDVCFQYEHSAYHDFKSAGTLDDWRKHIAALCVGNPILEFAVSAAFAGPLLKRVKQDSSLGIHLVGDSSKGKTTALHVAASVWGAPSFLKSWRGTSNGLESVATTRNDTLLVLDEISEGDPYEIGAIVYALGNGIGKQRANRHGASKETNRWRLLWLSSGERTLGAHMREVNQQPKAGQQVRLLDIPATEQLYGAFDNLHGHSNGGAFTNSLSQGYQRDYGHAGIEFIQQLIKDKRDLLALYTQALNFPQFAATDTMTSRAAKAFILIAMAGELAITYGILPWEKGVALQTSAVMYQKWQLFRDTTYTEDQQILKAVSDFIERFGEVRFSPLKTEFRVITPIHDRAGFWKDSVDGRIYYFFPSALERVVNGFDKARVARTLEAAGWLYERDKDKRTKKLILPDGNKMGLYALRINIDK